MSKPSNNKKSKKFIFWFWILGLSPFIFIAIMLIAASMSDLPSFKVLEDPKSNLASEILTSDNELLGKYYTQNRTNVNFEDLSPALVNALIATEDERYKNHSGVDFKSIMRAGIYMGNRGGGSTLTQQLAKLLFSERPKTKVERIFQKFQEWIIAARLEKSYTKEEILTMYLNQYDFVNNAIGIKSASRVYCDKYPSELNIEQAALLVGMLQNSSLYNPLKRKEMAKERRNVVLGQMLKNEMITQTQYDSLQYLPLGIKYTRASHEEGLAPYFREILKNEISSLFKEKNQDGNYKYAKNKDENIPFSIYSDGLRIYTTIDSRMQAYAEWAVNHYLEQGLQERFNKEISKNRNAPFSDDLSKKETDKILVSAKKRSNLYRILTGKVCGNCGRTTYIKEIKEDGKVVFFCEHPDCKSKRQAISEKQIDERFKTPKEMTVYTMNGERDTVMTPMDSILYYKRFLQAGLMSMNPKTGFVKAWVGGTNFKHFKYDHVKQGKRQVGSTIKPIIYATAIQAGFSPCEEIPNQRVCFDMPAGQDYYCPKNSSDKYGGMVTLSFALANSINSVSAWLVKQFGPDAVVKLAKDMGITSQLDAVPSICLGVADISVLEMTAANSTFVNQGVYIEPIIISRIEDRHGNIIYNAEPKTKEALDAKTAYTITQMMRGTADGAFNPSDGKRSGTAVRLRFDSPQRGYDGITDIPIACKTGTTQNNSDGWFMGLTPDLVTGVWVGAEDRSVRFGSTHYGQGANTSLPIWAYYMKKIYADESLDVSQGDFEKPSGIGFVDLTCKPEEGIFEFPEDPEDLWE